MKSHKILTALIVLGFAACLHGQYRIERSVVSSGGSPATGGSYQLNGTVGQAAIGTTQTNSYQNKIGFWYLTLPQTVQFTQALNSGWNMIGLPLQVADRFYLTLYPNAIPGTLFGFNGSYFVEDSLEIGQGYWLRLPAADLVNLSGQRLNSLTLNLAAGWNMIAGISCNVPLSSVQDPGGIIIPGTLFGFDGSYQPADTIRQGKGYWLRTSAAGPVSLNCGSSALAIYAGVTKTAGRISALKALEKEAPSIRISNGDGRAQTLLCDASLADGPDRLSFSMPPLPPKGAFDARFSSNLRLAEGDQSIIQIQSSDSPLRISTTNLPENEGDIYILQELLDDKVIQEHKLVNSASIEILNPKVRKLRLVRQKAVPAEFTLKQNYPNPFNPVTTIQFSLAVSGRTSLSIYNLLGEEVATLVSGEVPAGMHTIQWDGSGFASGVYFYRLKSGDEVKIRKLILLK